MASTPEERRARLVAALMRDVAAERVAALLAVLEAARAKYQR